LHSPYKTFLQDYETYARLMKARHQDIIPGNTLASGEARHQW
jgi:hypothetical protein